MRPLNPIRPDRFIDQRFVSGAPLYLTSDGSNTTDITQAVLDPYGSPINNGVSETETIPHEVYTNTSPLSFNPSDPTARQRAFEARASFSDSVTIPNCYQDKFELINYANSVSHLAFTKLKALKNSNKHE